MEKGKLRMTFEPGTDISTAAERAITLAQKANVDVVFEFNGIDVAVDTWCSVWTVVDQYNDKLRQRQLEKEQERPRPRAVLSHPDVRSPSARAIGLMIDALDGATEDERRRCIEAVGAYFGWQGPEVSPEHRKVNDGLEKSYREDLGREFGGEAAAVVYAKDRDKSQGCFYLRITEGELPPEFATIVTEDGATWYRMDEPCPPKP